MKFLRFITVAFIAFAFWISFAPRADAVVPTWDVALTGSPPQTGAGGSGMGMSSQNAWFVSKERQISFDISSISSFSDLGSALGDVVSSIGSNIMPSWDSIAYYLARMVVVSIKEDLINWARGGFNGTPNFINKPEQFFLDVADQASAVFIEELGQYIAGNPNFLCSDLSFNLQLTMPGAPGGYRRRARCTLDQALQNVNSTAQRFQNNFAEGGWNNFIRINQSNNNFGGNYILALEARQNKVAQDSFNRIQGAMWGNGYLGPEKCRAGTSNQYGCGEFRIQSPGKLVGDRVGQVVGSDIQSIISSDEVSELVQIMLNMVVNSLINDFMNGNNDTGGIGF